MQIVLFHVNLNDLNLNDLKINLQNKNIAPKISKVKHAEPPTNKVATPPQTKILQTFIKSNVGKKEHKQRKTKI